MAITLQSIYDTIDDFRTDNTPGTVAIETEGLRAINFILEDIQSRHDWEFTQLDNTFRYYNGIHQYALPNSFKSIRSVYPVSTYFDDFRFVEPTVFKRLVRPGGYYERLIAVERSGLPRLYVNNCSTTSRSTPIISNSAYNENGTWVGTLDATDVKTDGQVYHENNGSVSFDIDVSLSGSNAATLTNALLSSPVDLTDYRDGKLFMWVYFSANSNLSNLELRWGSSSGNYYASTQTTQFDGSYLDNGWNLFGFDFENAVVTGNPDITAIDYLQLTINYSASMGDLPNVRIGELTAKTYEDHILKYYTYDMVNDVSIPGHVRKFDGTSNLDEFLMSDEMETLVQTGVAWVLLKQMGDMELAETYRVQYEGSNGQAGLMKRFMDKFPAKTKKPEPPMLYV